MTGTDQRLPIIPLADVVHFPRTSLRIHVHEPRYRRLVRDLLTKDEETRLIGLVLVKPGHQQPEERHRAIFPGGTAGQLVDFELLSDGRSNIVLEGRFRFVVRHEVGFEPYREAVIEPVEEPRYNNEDAGIQLVRTEILDLASKLAKESPGRFPFDGEKLADLRSRSSFEEVVNAVSAELDVPTLRKLQLLVASLPDRALNLLSILRARQRVLDLLRPFRPLADVADLN